MEETPILYYNDISPPVRFVLMTIKALNLNVELREIDFLKQENRSPEFLKINPLHRVPTLIVGSKVINDSHAICTYLVDKYAPNSPLYPKDIEERTKIDCMLYFNSGTFFPRESAILQSPFKIKHDMPFERLVELFEESLSYLESLIGEFKWLNGDHMTLADYCCISTYSSAKLMLEIKKGTYPNIDSWESMCVSDAVYRQVNMSGLENLKVFLRNYGKFDHVDEKFRPFIRKNVMENC